MVSDASLERDEKLSRSLLFTMRVWLEDLGEGKTEWRGKVQLVEDGQVFYFRDWQVLITNLQTLLEDKKSILGSAELNPTPPD